jgi:uncharacterized protein YtpQ (UPF0354 family)
MAFFDRLFSKIENNQIKEDKEVLVNVERSIFPVIRNPDDPKIKFNTPPVLTDNLADGIVICYVLEMGDNFGMLSESNLKGFGLTIDDVRQLAMRNLIDKVNANCKVIVKGISRQTPKIKPFYGVEMSNNFNPSMMLLDEFWDITVKDILRSEIIAVSIPARNIISFSDMKVIESFRSMQSVTNHIYETSIKDGIALTTNTYIRKNGKWDLFVDNVT